MDSMISKLLNSDEPSVRYKVMVSALDYGAETAVCQQLRQEIKTSSRVQKLLSERDDTGHIPHHPYTKWVGAHWLLTGLADIGYPPGDEMLIPLREDVYRWLFGQSHQKSIRMINGRVRRCASQEGNALYYIVGVGNG